MGIAAQVFNDLFWSGKGALCVHDPVGSIKQLDQFFKFTGATVDLCVSREDELPVSKGFFKLFKITLTKLLCQRLHFKQVRVSGRYPSGFVKRQSPGRNEAMHMEVIQQNLVPCV